MYATASVHKENSKAYGNDSPPAEAFKGNEKLTEMALKCELL